MKPLTVVAVLLIILGVVGLASGHLSFTTKKEVIDLGPIQASVDEKHEVPIPEIAGILAIVGGVGLLIVGSRRA